MNHRIAREAMVFSRELSTAAAHIYLGTRMMPRGGVKIMAREKGV